MSTGPRLNVESPAFVPSPFGLWATVQTPDDPDGHWRNGVNIQGEVCDEAAVTADPCPTPPDDKEPTSDGVPTRGATAFTVYAWVNCGPVGQWGDGGAAFTQRSLEALYRGEARAAEREFWTGAGGTTPHLAENAAVTDAVSGVVVSVQTAADIVITGVGAARAIGAIEGALAECYGGLGVIHIPFGAVSTAGTDGVLVVRGGKLYTLAGTPVVAGAGYPGTSPAGAAPAAGTSWFYGTGAIVGRRSAATTTKPGESLNRETNDEVIIAERTYSFIWDCCHVAALATL